MAELLSEVAARSFDRLNQTLKTARDEAGTDPAERIYNVARAYVGFAQTYPNHFRLMFRRDGMASDNESLMQAAASTFAEMTNSVTLQRGEPEVTVETLQVRMEQRSLQNDIILAWSQIHGYAQLLLEGQFEEFAEKEGLEAFVDRTVAEASTRLSEVFKQR